MAKEKRMAGSFIIQAVDIEGGGQVVYSMDYDDQLRATNFGITNTSAQAVQGTVIGLNAAGDADPANRTYALIAQPGQSVNVSIPAANANKNVQLSVIAKNGRIGGFNFTAG